MSHLNPRSVRLAILFYVGMALGGVLCLTGCTGSLDWQAHYPGKHNPIAEYQPGSGRTVYQGYTPPYPMDPPAADSPAWYQGMDLGLRN